MANRALLRPVRTMIVAVSMLSSTLGVAEVRLSIGVAVPGVAIGVNIPAYPDLVPVPGYPVYYAPRLNTNLFFYDGLYWVYADDNWYSSAWYGGPWRLVEPSIVPDFILRIPLRYYRRPPPYFLHWNREAPPRWADHWGPKWQEHRSGWDRWDRRFVPPRAPLPRFQREYPGNRYPNPGDQRALEERYYHHRPRGENARRPNDRDRAPGRIEPRPDRPPLHRHPGDQRGMPPASHSTRRAQRQIARTARRSPTIAPHPKRVILGLEVRIAGNDHLRLLMPR